MADVRALRGWRYNLGRVGELSAVVAPPYDVIGPALQEALYARHPANVVRLILGKQAAQDSESDNRYTRAARYLREWKADGVLAEDRAPALYVCAQQYSVEGRSHTRRGFLARLRLEPFGAGQVYPHEETMPGPKADRLRLFHATGMNLSPIFGIYPDSDSQVQQAIETVVRGQPAIEAADHLGVVTRLWLVESDDVVSRVQGLMGPRPIFIADGHHRYETALRYRDDQRAAGSASGEQAPANFVLAMFVGMSDPGLLILPTHRLASGLSGLNADALRGALEAEFATQEVGQGPDACREAWERIAADGGQNLLGFGTVADGRWQIARLRRSAAMDRLVPQHSAEWRGLAVSILHELVFQELLAPRTSGQRPELRYVHLLDEVLDAASNRHCDLACLVPPATMQHVERIALGGERMPAKSTYFYPKLLSGLVFNPIA
jgi:uncharacterized protein (DUF1015 family)